MACFNHLTEALMEAADALSSKPTPPQPAVAARKIDKPTTRD
jgi:hypothetical protein